MNDEQRNAKIKRNLLIEMIRNKFEDEVFEYLEAGDYDSMEELDRWLDEKLQKLEAEENLVRSYYEGKIYS